MLWYFIRHNYITLFTVLVQLANCFSGVTLDWLHITMEVLQLIIIKPTEYWNATAKALSWKKQHEANNDKRGHSSSQVPPQLETYPLLQGIRGIMHHSIVRQSVVHNHVNRASQNSTSYKQTVSLTNLLHKHLWVYGFLIIFTQQCQNCHRTHSSNKKLTREHWIQCITFAIKTNAACCRSVTRWTLTQRDSVTLSGRLPSLAKRRWR